MEGKREAGRGGMAAQGETQPAPAEAPRGDLQALPPPHSKTTQALSVSNG